MKRRMILLFIVFTTLFSYGSVLLNEEVKERLYRPYEGVVIVLDAGHGGKDQGAQFNGVYESELNLLVVLKLKTILEEVGVEVRLTRTDEKDLALKNAIKRKNEDLKKRMEIINEKKVDLYVSVHMNSFMDTSVKGAQVFYKKGNIDAQTFADKVQKEISTCTKTSFHAKSGDYYILNESDKLGVLIECGFLSNVEEREKLINENYQSEIAEAIGKGIIQFLQEIYE